MKKLAKPSKVMVKGGVAPDDQIPLRTQCGFCKKQFANPTTARIHLDRIHPIPLRNTIEAMQAAEDASRKVFEEEKRRK